jgi:ferredoxin-NADP reductase
MTTLQVSSVEPLTPRASIVRLTLGSRPFSYRAGQAVPVRRNGSDATDWYSIAVCPGVAEAQGCLELLVGTEVRRDRRMPPSFVAGEDVEIGRPTGQMVLPSGGAARLAFIAGGLGIAPLRALLQDALGCGHGDVTLVYSARTPDDFAFRDEFRDLARTGRIALSERVTRYTNDDWQGARERLGTPDMSSLVDPQDTEYFICGPVSFVLDVSTTLGNLGVSIARLHADLRLTPAIEATVERTRLSHDTCRIGL